MRKIFLLMMVCAVAVAAMAQNKISTQQLSGTKPDTVLKRYIEGEGVEISGGRFNGSTGNISSTIIGHFNRNNANFAFDKGIYMITGGDYDCSSNNFTDKNVNDLQNVGNGRGAALDFYFTAYADTFAFNYVFASSEYSSFTCSSYNDIFAFFLEGWDPVLFQQSTRNIAIIPGSVSAQNPNGIPVKINTVNSGQCSGSNTPGTGMYLNYNNFWTNSYNSSYPNNFVSGIALNGSTVSLAAEGKVWACQEYKMSMQISNVSDNAYQSAVFIEEGSFYSPEISIKENYGGNNMVSGDTLIQNCRELDINFTLPYTPLTGDISVTMSYSGDAVINQDYGIYKTFVNTNNQIDTMFFSVSETGFVWGTNGDTVQTLHVSILPTAQLQQGQIKTVKLIFDTERCADNPKSHIYDTLVFYLLGNDSIRLNKENLTFGACDTLKSIEMELLKGNPATYTWTPSAGILQPNVLSPQTQITNSGTVMLKVADQWNCMKDSAEVIVNIVPKPDFTINRTPSSGCLPLNVTLQTQYTPSYSTLQWTVTGESGFMQQDDQSLFIATLPDEGWYDVKLVVESAPGCSDSTTLTNAVHVSDYPVADFTFSPEEPHNGEEIQFMNNSTGDNIVSHVWNFGDGTSSYIENPTHAYHLYESDIKTVILTVTNADGCVGEVIKTVPVEDDFAMWVPSSFSPIPGGKNTVFMPVASDISEKYSMEIYSRNGTLVFKTDYPNTGWDGTINGMPAPEGVYVYRIYYSRIGTPDEIKVKTGSITLVR